MAVDHKRAVKLTWVLTKINLLFRLNLSGSSCKLHKGLSELFLQNRPEK